MSKLESGSAEALDDLQRSSEVSPLLLAVRSAARLTGPAWDPRPHLGGEEHRPSRGCPSSPASLWDFGMSLHFCALWVFSSVKGSLPSVRVIIMKTECENVDEVTSSEPS